MTTPSLFEDIEAADRERRERPWKQPATCPSCHVTEPSGYLLRNNHGYLPIGLRDGVDGYGREQGTRHLIYGLMCGAQYAVMNHIIGGIWRNEPTFVAERSERARDLGLDVEAIVTAAREWPTGQRGINRRLVEQFGSVAA